MIGPLHCKRREILAQESMSHSFLTLYMYKYSSISNIRGKRSPASMCLCSQKSEKVPSVFCQCTFPDKCYLNICEAQDEYSLRATLRYTIEFSKTWMYCTACMVLDDRNLCFLLQRNFCHNLLAGWTPAGLPSFLSSWFLAFLVSCLPGFLSS